MSKLLSGAVVQFPCSLFLALPADAGAAAVAGAGVRSNLDKARSLEQPAQHARASHGQRRLQRKLGACVLPVASTRTTCRATRRRVFPVFPGLARAVRHRGEGARQRRSPRSSRTRKVEPDAEDAPRAARRSFQARDARRAEDDARLRAHRRERRAESPEVAHRGEGLHLRHKQSGELPQLYR